MKLATVVVVALALVLVATTAFAGMNILHKLAVHVKSHPTSCTEGYPSFPSCVAIKDTYAGCGDVDVMPVFWDVVAFTEVEFGLRWSHPSASMLWTRCAGDVAQGTISHPGDGTIIVWSTCQTPFSVAPGYGWILVSSPEYICPCPNPETGSFGMTDCSPAPGPYFDWPIWGGYCGGICGGIGDEACRPDAAEPSTWGAIKAMMK
jgi:hypothetical protein